MELAQWSSPLEDRCSRSTLGTTRHQYQREPMRAENKYACVALSPPSESGYVELHNATSSYADGAALLRRGEEPYATWPIGANGEVHYATDDIVWDGDGDGEGERKSKARAE